MIIQAIITTGPLQMVNESKWRQIESFDALTEYLNTDYENRIKGKVVVLVDIDGLRFEINYAFKNLSVGPLWSPTLDIIDELTKHVTIGKRALEILCKM